MTNPEFPSPQPVPNLMQPACRYISDVLASDATPSEKHIARCVMHLLPLQAMVTGAASDVLAERQRQISAEGWTPEHDDEHGRGELSRAAACYALHAASQSSEHPGISLSLESSALGVWPWDQSWHKPSDVRRNLVKAGALILAEIERLDRAGAQA